MGSITLAGLDFSYSSSLVYDHDEVFPGFFDFTYCDSLVVGFWCCFCFFALFYSLIFFLSFFPVILLLHPLLNLV